MPSMVILFKDQLKQMTKGDPALSSTLKLLMLRTALIPILQFET